MTEVTGMQTARPTPDNADQANKFFTLNQFLGMNTLAPRFALADGEFSYLENLLPIASASQSPIGGQRATSSVLTSVPPQGANLPALPTGQSIDRMWQFAVGPGAGQSATNWIIVHTAQGNLYAYDIDTTPVSSPVKINGSVLFAQPDMATWQGTQLLVVDIQAGYYSFTLTGLSNALTWSAGVAQTAPASNLSLIAVAFGRVWVLANTQTILASAPNSYTDFTAINGAVSTTIANDGLRRAVTRLKLNGDYLYIIGDGAVYAISNVQASGAFLLSEVERSHGTTFYGAVESIDRTIVFASSDNLYAVQGYYPTALMPTMANFFHDSLDFQTQPLVVTLATILGVQTLLVLAKYKDPTLGPRSVFIALCKGNAMILSQATTAIKWACTVEIVDPNDGHSDFHTYATDGTHIFKCFDDDIDNKDYSGAAGVTWKFQTKLYDLGNPAFNKLFVRTGLSAFATSPFGTLTLETDTEARLSSTSQFNLQQFIWVNNAGAIIQFTGLGGANINFVGAGIIFPQYKAELSGRYLGYTVSGTTPNVSIAALMTEYAPMAPWFSGGVS